MYFQVENYKNMNFKISIAFVCTLMLAYHCKAQKITFAYVNGHTVSEQLSGGTTDIEIASSADCETEEVSIVLSSVDSVHWKDGYEGTNRQLSVTSGSFYDFDYYHSNGCIDSASVWIDPAIPNSTSIDGPTEVSYYGNSYLYTAIGGVKSTYSWSFVGDSISSTNSKDASVFWQRHIDTFKVRVTENGMYGCTGPQVSISVLNKFVSARKSHEASFSIYPNPVDHVLIVDGLEVVAEYTVFSSTGTQVLRGVFQKSIAIDALPSGQYILEVKTNSERSRHLFAKL